MLKIIRLFLIAAALLAGFAACSKKQTAAELNAERAKVWKEQQKAKAAKYYQEIVNTFPDSPFAAQAKERLAAIGPVTTPKPTPAKK